MRTRPFPALAASVLACLLCASCEERETPEQKIRRALEETVGALEKGDVAGAGEVLSDEYQDASGRTKQQLKGIALFALRRGPVQVMLRDVQVDVQGEQATVKLAAWAVQGAAVVETAGDLLPQGARRFDLTLSFAKEGDAWRVRALDGDGAGGSPYE